MFAVISNSNGYYTYEGEVPYLDRHEVD